MTMHRNAATEHELMQPGLEWLFEVRVKMGARIAAGTCYAGSRFLIPLTGGYVKGPRLNGRVLPGGIDRQIERSDGVLEMDAQYELESDDGVVVSVFDRVLHVKNEGSKKVRALTQARMIAPNGRYSWLNSLSIVGSLENAEMGSDFVIVQMYALTLPQER
jgi:hypothetical protein